MSLDFVARIKKVAAVASILLLGASGLSLAQQQKDAPAPSKGDASRAEKVAGVITKVEKVRKQGETASKEEKAKAKGKRGSVFFRLSINTNAVWRDWARDQAQVRDEGTPKQDAAKGASSIATKGQPADENSLVVVDVAPSTQVVTRFRSPTDETSQGATAPEKVKSDEATSSKVSPTEKPVHFRAEDLLPGLFVEAEFGPTGPRGKETASTIAVIRPIEVINTSPKAESAPK